MKTFLRIFFFKVTSDPPWWISYFEFFVEGILLITVASFGIVGRSSPLKLLLLCTYSLKTCHSAFTSSLKNISLVYIHLKYITRSAYINFNIYFFLAFALLSSSQHRWVVWNVVLLASNRKLSKKWSLNFNCFRLSTKRSTIFSYCFLCLIW